ncbi:hypothetical protein [Pseudomonas saliphila]|uniref:hypothetical protein n=1 Tax=Pseudomonas saliphila TaxID=2586906 RepID=UPI00123B730D|nr:hypothetical protein [Pseudomonas saliphila]
MENSTVTIIINGLAGTARYSSYGIELRGPWASHTGFISLCSMAKQGDDSADLYALAEERYNQQKCYAFAVGDEHREHGWKTLSMGFNGCIEIRLPSWHKGVVAEALESYGMIFDCKLNCRWVFPANCGVDMGLARAIFAPILQQNTRFADEVFLAQQIDLAARQAGYCSRLPLQQGEAQRALF